MAERLKRLFGAQDMTVGRPLMNLAAFSIPLLIGNLAQQMYNTVDSIIVGKYVGDSALAAVGAAGPILNLMLLLFMGISTGAGILVAQYFGARKKEELSKAVGTCLTLTLIASAIIMVVGPLITRPLMTLLGAGVKNVALKLGGAGCLVKNASERFALPAYPGAKCVDTTGAGDTFAAAFIASILEGRSIAHCAAFANAAASLCVERLGATAAPMNRDELEKRYRHICDLGDI